MTTGESLALSEDQRALQDTVRGFLTDDPASAELRGSLDSETGYSGKLHARMAGELGLCGLTIPEEFGGRGLSPVEACIVHTELGRVLYPGPFMPSYLAAEALLAAGDREASEKWLPQLADGSVVGTVAAADEAGHWSSGSDSVRAERTPGGWRLFGRRWFVIAAHVAGIVVVPAVAESGLAVFLVESGSPGLVVSRHLSLDLTRRISITSFNATPALLLSQGDDAAKALDRAECEFLLAIAAEAAGGIGWCLDASIAYVEDRERFGRPIGSFETEAHYCVEMLADFETVSSAARYAAVATADGAADAPMAARVAALRAGQSYRGVTEAAIHLFGGIGFSRENEANLYYRRAWSAERLVGGPHAQRTAIVDLASPLLRHPGPVARITEGILLLRRTRSRDERSANRSAMSANSRVLMVGSEPFRTADVPETGTLAAFGCRHGVRNSGRIAQW
jgi:alkylation response protein AidB-like acyl-CoA dehydrogenase